MSWTNIPKPTSSTWTTVSFQGKQLYDDPNIEYDDDEVYDDTVNQTAWTDVAKPTGGNSATIVAGMVTGLVMPVTYSTSHDVSGDPWIKINKPT